MAITSLGISSGLNYEQIISQLLDIERKPAELLQSKQKNNESKIASFLDISTKLSSFKSALDSLNSKENFNTKTASVTKTSGGAELLTVTGSDSAAAGSYSVQVNQLATASKKASQGWADMNTTVVAAASGSLKFKVGSGGAETTVSVSGTTTLQGLRDAINTADAGVTASIIHDGTGSNPYRLILTASATGSSNPIYINQNDTNLDFANKQVEDAYSYTSNSYSGTAASNAGNHYTGTTNKTFLMQIVTGGTPGSAAAKYKYSIDGGINWLGSGGAAYTGSNGVTVAADNTLQNIDGLADGSTTTEGAKIKFTGGTLAADDKFSVDVFNPAMQSAQDAVLNIDGATITKSTNSITDVIQGVTLDLLKADTSSTLTLTVSSDTSSARTNIKKFVEAYNTVIKAIDDQLSYDPVTKSKTPLQGDATLTEIRRKITNAISGAIPGLSSSGYQNLSQVGITSNSKTSKLSLDESKLTASIKANPDAVAKLFIGTATATHAAVSYVSKTSETQPGRYSIDVATAPQKAVIGGSSASDTLDLSSNGLTANEMLTFMVSKNKTESTPDYTTFNITLSAGATINTIVNNLNSAFATNDVDLSASNDSGKLKITSTDYGADIWFQATTDQSGDGASTWQIWNSTGTRSDAGLDIVGNINNHVANGTGNVLTALAGFPEEGLKIIVDSNQTGGFGSISISSGIADRLSSSIASYTNATSGMIKLKTDSVQKTVDHLAEQQKKIEDKLADKEKKLREQFARLETLLTKYKAQSDYLTNQLSQLAKIWEK